MEEFKYFNNMQDIHSDIYDKISEKLSEVKSVNVTANDVKRTLGKIKNNEALDHIDYYNMLSDAAIDFIEELGEISQKLRLQYFGNNVYLFSPLYIANYCENSCKYCGFRAKSDIVRAKLTMDEIESEMKQMRREKIEDVLILTGESQKYS
ncbi:MAG: 2-iminoacetate synthase ThiH, partial [Finegoldia magna]|nr:2-iminoacetate synthase ThiH [Finegoldia magna]